MSKAELRELRNGLYKWIIDYLTKHRTDNNLFILKNANEKGRAEKGKAIIIVKSFAEAIKIKNAIEREITQTNLKLETAALSSGLSATPIKQKIKIIGALSNVFLSKNGAQKRIGMKGKDVKPYIEQYIKHLQSEETLDTDEISRAKKLCKSISKDKLYIYATDTGTSYRVTYFNSVDNKRKQETVCDVLIIAGENVNLIDAPLRKERSDRAEQLGTFYTYTLGVPIFHRLYNYDVRYIGRYNSAKGKNIEKVGNE